MKVIGTAKEIEWLKEAIQNNCDQCPYLEPCNESAKQDDRLHGKVQHTCKEFLEEAIEFIIEDNVQNYILYIK